MFSFGYSFGPAFGGAGALVISLIALGAVIALSLFCYVKFMGKNAAATDKDGKIGAFFNMKKLYLEQVIKILYMVCAVAIAVFSVVTPFLMWAALGSFLMFLLGLVVGAVNLALGEVLCRLVYEYLYMFVRMAGDTRAIRTKVEGGTPLAPKEPEEAAKAK